MGRWNSASEALYNRELMGSCMVGLHGGGLCGRKDVPCGHCIHQESE